MHSAARRSSVHGGEPSIVSRQELMIAGWSRYLPLVAAQDPSIVRWYQVDEVMHVVRSDR